MRRHFLAFYKVTKQRDNAPLKEFIFPFHPETKESNSPYFYTHYVLARKPRCPQKFLVQLFGFLSIDRPKNFSTTKNTLDRPKTFRPRETILDRPKNILDRPKNSRTTKNFLDRCKKFSTGQKILDRQKTFSTGAKNSRPAKKKTRPVKNSRPVKKFLDPRKQMKDQYQICISLDGITFGLVILKTGSEK